MRGANYISFARGRFSVSLIVVSLSFLLASCGAVSTVGNLWDQLPDAPDANASLAEKSDRSKVLDELKSLRAELQRRTGRLETDLKAAKAELARRQGAGEIDQAKVNLTPAEIRDSQLSELEKLRAELERRQSGEARKKRIVSAALTENEVAYRHIDACLGRGNGDFRGVFDGRPDLVPVIQEKGNQVYSNADRSVLLFTSKDSCDVSFSGTSVNNFATGLVHILETQGGIVESKKLAGLTVITVVHPRGNFRLASGRKVIGQGGGTNLYTTISAI